MGVSKGWVGVPGQQSKRQRASNHDMSMSPTQPLLVEHDTNQPQVKATGPPSSWIQNAIDASEDFVALGGGSGSGEDGF